MLPQPVGVVLRRAVHRYRCVEPVTGAVDGQVRGSGGQHLKRRAEVAWGVARYGDPEPDVLPLDALVRRLQRRSSPDEDGAGDATGERAGAEGCALGVDLQRCGAFTVDVNVDDGLPVVREVLQQLAVDRRDVERHGAGHDQRPGVVRGPQRVDDGAHQPQHAAGALEALERRPVLVEPVEQLRVYRVGRLDPVFVGDLTALARELPSVLAVELHELASDSCDVALGGGVRLDEQSPADDLKRLVRRGGPPLVSDTPNDVLQSLERLATVETADLQIAAPVDVGVPRVARRRDRDDQECPGHRLDRLGERLREGELGVERAGWEVVPSVELPGVRHPLVNQDQAGRVLTQQGCQRSPGIGAVAVVLRDDVVGGPAAQLPGQLAPESAHLRAVVLDAGLAGRQVRADQRHTADAPEGGQVHTRQRLLDLLRVLPHGRV